MYKTILFDLDGTITDSKAGITKSVQFALSQFSIDVNNLEDLEIFIGPPLKQSFIDYYDFSSTDADTAIKYYREYYTETGKYENLVYPGITRLLELLTENGFQLAVATSKPTVFAEEILDYFNLSKYFSFIAGSNLDLTRSDKKEVIAYALDELKIQDRKSVIMIGDRKHDIIGARENNVASIGVLYGYGSHIELLSENPDYLIYSANEIEQLLIEKD